MDDSENEDKDNWLRSYSRKVTSQFGEDGIIEKIFTIIDGNKWCVEFGASDGKSRSNTWNLINNQNWSAVLIESSKKSYKKLVERYKANKNVICLNTHISFSGQNRIDKVLSKTPIPKDFDLMSIDIDGNDYHIWKSIVVYDPKVVMIEFNPTIPNNIEFIQMRNMKVRQGNSLLALVKLGKEKGFELVATTDVNAILVKKKYFELFNIEDNSIETLHKDNKYLTQVFQLFDGTLVLNGLNKLKWHNLEISNKKIQALPKIFRKYPQTLLFKIYRKFKRLFPFLKAKLGITN
jgi:hypothetical protein